MEITEYLKQRRNLVDDAIKDYFTGQNPFFDVMYYSLDTGKRIRPILAIASFEANGGKDIRKIMPIACGLELIHTYSLIHDDLPAMDNDDFRRGKVSSHRKFGEAMAILSGDGLFAYAFELFTMGNDLVKERYKVIRAITQAVGPKGIVYGQVLDITDNKEPTPRILKQIHLNKTAKFIALAIQVGAMMANAPQKVISNLTQTGLYLGMLFQYTDDILDVIGVKEKLGKTPRKDESAGKLTAPGVYGLKGATFRARRYAELIKNRFAKLGAEFQVFIQLTDFLLKRTF